jgi:hypothetical protein
MQTRRHPFTIQRVFGSLNGIATVTAFLCLVVSVTGAAESRSGGGVSPEIQVATSDIDVGIVLSQPSGSSTILSSRLTVTGPRGQVVYEEQGDWDTLLWQPPANVPDGHYTWEAVYVIPDNSPKSQGVGHGAAAKTSNRQMVRKSGTVFLQDGIILERAPSVSEPSEGEFPEHDPDRLGFSGIGSAGNATQQHQAVGAWPVRVVAKIADFFIPRAHAQETQGGPVFTTDVESESFDPDFLLDDTDIDSSGLGSANAEWFFSADGIPTILRIKGVNASTSTLDDLLSIHSEAGDGAVSIKQSGTLCVSTSGDCDVSGSGGTDMTVRSNAPAVEWIDTDDPDGQKWGIFTDAGDGFAITDRTGGDNQVIFAGEGAIDHALHISSGSDGDIGLGTATPSSKLHLLQNPFPDIRIDNGSQFVEMEFDSGVFGISDDNAFVSQRPFQIEVGDNPPADSFVLAGDGGIGLGTDSPDTPLHVARSDNSASIRVEDDGSGSPQVMFQLINNGFPQFNMQDTSQSDVNWSFRLSGTAGSTERFTITKIGTGGAEFELFADGSANFRGPVTADGVMLTSTREAKTDFQDIDEGEVLDKLARLEIRQWRYKDEAQGTAHIGPVAEEFHEVFGLSDDQRLNLIDTNGIAFAAIQALDEENEALRAENREIRKRLRAENREIRNRLESLEHRLEN